MTNTLGWEENPILDVELALNDSGNNLGSQILYHFKRIGEEWATRSLPALKLSYLTNADILILYKIISTIYHFVKVCQRVV